VVGIDAPIRRSRRALLAGAAGAAGAGLISGCGNKALRVKIRNGATVPAADADTLNALLDIENYAIGVYAAGIPFLGPAAQLVGKQFLAQELSHALELSELIKAAGARPHKRPSTYNLGTPPRNATEAFALLERVEREQLNAYLKMIPSLSSGHVRATIATIFANDAQHLAVLRQQAGQALPGAFSIS
jgi:hypothetical protein